MELELKQKGGEIEELRKQLERESMVMSKEKREEKEREIRIKLNDFMFPFNTVWLKKVSCYTQTDISTK